MAQVTNITIKIKENAGFTLLEISMVMAIIGILAMYAMPMYEDYVARAQMTEPFSIISGVKPKVLEVYENTHSLNDIDGWRHTIFPAPRELSGRYVEKIVIANGAFLVYMRHYGVAAPLKDGLFLFYPKKLATTPLSVYDGEDGAAYSEGWACMSIMYIPAKYFPVECSPPLVPRS